MLHELLNDFVTLFVVIDPIGILPLFIGLTYRLNDTERRAVALRGTVIAAALLVLFAVFGQMLLSAIGVSLSSFRIAGGVILFVVGLRMVFEAPPTLKEGERVEDHDIAVFPVAIPYLAGPGALLAVVVLMQQKNMTPVLLGSKLMVILLVLLISYLFLCFASRIQKIIGKTGGLVIERVFGMLLAALAAESVSAGIVEFLKTIQGG